MSNLTLGIFSKCSSLRTISIPENIKKIQLEAFAYCSNLKSVEIGKGVEIIQGSVFKGCTSLTTIAVHEENEFFTVDNNVLYSKDKKELIQYPLAAQMKEYQTLETTTSMDNYAFKGSAHLEVLIFTSSISAIPTGAVANSKKLKTVKIEGTIKSIGGNAFAGCTSLETIEYSGTDEPETCGSNLFNEIKSTTVTVTEDFIGDDFCGKDVVKNTIDSTDEKPEEVNELSGGEVAAIVIGSIIGVCVFVALFMIVVVFFLKKFKPTKSSYQDV